MKTFVPEIIVMLLLGVFAALLWNPYWMPMGWLYAVLVIFVILLGSFSVFIWREKGGDERDVLIKHIASRFAYLIGALVMAVGIVYEALSHHSVNSWLLIAFIITVFGKAVGFIYGKNKY